MKWKPIELDKLNWLVERDENELKDQSKILWANIKIPPEKWIQSPFGDEGNGFWVVAVHKDQCLYYNDIEDGFNWGKFTVKGIIDDYQCNQDSIEMALNRISV